MFPPRAEIVLEVIEMAADGEVLELLIVMLEPFEVSVLVLAMEMPPLPDVEKLIEPFCTPEDPAVTITLFTEMAPDGPDDETMSVEPPAMVDFAPAMVPRLTWMGELRV